MHRILVVGDPSSHHVGGALLAAASELGYASACCDVRTAVGNRYIHSLRWHFFDRTYGRQRTFESHLLREFREYEPTIVIVTGTSPVAFDAVSSIRRTGVPIVNVLTDDPYNPSFRSSWLLKTLPRYDAIFSPRRSNIKDLSILGCERVFYMPFGYNPNLHFPCDGPLDRPARLVFIGGADRDRVPYIHALVDAGIPITAFGGYWNRFARKGLTVGGIAHPEELRDALRRCAATVILVRRANRDGHVMRSIESAATRACMLVEDTNEHRELFGCDGEAVRYFSNERSLVAVATDIINAPACERLRLATAAHRRIAIEGRHTYADRLDTILKVVAS